MSKTASKSGAENGISLYELMLILNPDLRESDVKKKLKEFEELITKGGGKVVTDDLWGKRNLAYRLKKRSEGIYMVYNLELPASFVKELREALRIEKELLRSMIIKLPAGYTYTKFDMSVVPKQDKKREVYKKNVSYKHNAPVAHHEKMKEEKPGEKGKEANAVDLDKKLDQIIGGSDLKL